MDEHTKDQELADDIELTGEDNAVDPELEEVEDAADTKLKKLREKLKACEAEKMEHLENLQRTKAEFLNSKKRLEEERLRDKERAVEAQIIKLLPLCDSFHMAMADTDAWEAIDPTWRKGVEGIHNQLQSILDSYGVTQVDPAGEDFDPEQHEAMSNVPVDDTAQHGKIVQVLQNGFVRTAGDTQTLLRPARVMVGEHETN